MVPLQASGQLERGRKKDVKKVTKHTEFLLDDLENLLLVELLRKTLNSGQSLTTIALCCDING